MENYSSNWDMYGHDFGLYLTTFFIQNMTNPTKRFGYVSYFMRNFISKMRILAFMILTVIGPVFKEAKVVLRVGN
jgi:hypothetical protein